MELRSCNSLHFLQTIKGGSVTKVCNVNSHKMPALVFKKLEDIFERDDAKNINRASTLNWQKRYGDLLHDTDKVKTGSFCLPLAERKTKEVVLENDEFDSSCGYIEEDDQDELGFGQMTLKQLKDSCKSRKRKDFTSFGLVVKQECIALQPKEDEFKDCKQPEEDEGDDPDLEKPLCTWKSKLLQNPRAKRKFIGHGDSITSQRVCSVKPEQVINIEDSLVNARDLSEHVSIKEEVLEGFQCPSMICVSENSTVSCNKPVGVCGVPEEILESVECELKNGEPMICTEDWKSCAVNEVSYDHLEHFEASHLICSTDGETMEGGNEEKTCQQPSIFRSVSRVSGLNNEMKANDSFITESHPNTISPVQDQSLASCNPQTSNPGNVLEQLSGDCKFQVLDAAIDGKLRCNEHNLGENFEMFENDVSEALPSDLEDGSMFENDVKEALPSNLEDGSLTSSADNNSSTWNSHPCSSPDHNLASLEDDSPAFENQPLLSIVSAGNPLNFNGELIILEDGLAKTEAKQHISSIPTDAERISSSGNHLCDVTHEPSISEVSTFRCSEQLHTPERIPSTRKVISPRSQEILCLAMNSIEVSGEAAPCECQGKLCFEVETNDKVSPVRSNIRGTKFTIGPEGSREATQSKATLGSKQILRKTKNARKGPPHGDSIEDPHFLRSLPRVSTGCTSLQGCSENAILFSQRQMHDIESVATKLLNELNSMKNIVEEKLLYEAYRNRFLKQEADEVKIAIGNATKAEERAKKLLSIMSRDCKRFCKIMKLTGNGTPDSVKEIHREKKKISFADETGGRLCHVKLFKDGCVSPESKCEDSDRAS